LSKKGQFFAKFFGKNILTRAGICSVVEQSSSACATSLLTCSTRVQAMWYMPMHIAEQIACIIFLYMNIFVCLTKHARLLAIISNFFLGGGDNSILWLSFAQQKT
jgi:hypothetical protein